MNLTHSWRRYRKCVLALFFYSAIMGHSVSAIDFMPVKEVKSGMEGYAETVIEGDSLVSFPVKILGIMKQRGPSGDLILAKFSGPIMEQTGGIVQGMSGSPVYIKGKLVGAVAYGWSFTDGTIGMITPIEQMTKLWNVPYQKELPNPWKDTQLIPMGTTLMADGFDPTSLQFLEAKFKDYKYTAYPTATTDEDEVKKPLFAGGPVSALLIKGDLKMGAIGTVTYVDKDRIVAFGHQFLKRGSVDYFMNNSRILTIIKSVSSGFKLGSMGQEVGRITEDRGAGIAGVQGQIGKGIPVSMYLRDLDTGKERNAGVTVVEDKSLTPTLVATSIYSMLNKTLDRTGEGTAKVTLDIRTQDPSIKPFHRINWFYSANSISEKSIEDIYDIIDSLMSNTFKEYAISGIDVKVDVQKEKRTARIIDAVADNTVVAPGDIIVVDVNLQPYRKEPIVREVIYTVPKDQKMGKYTLEVRGGGVVPLPYLFEKQKYNLTEEVIRRIKTHKNFDAYYNDILDDDTNNQIVVEILEDGISMVEDGTEKVKKKRLDAIESSDLPSKVKGAKGKPQEGSLEEEKKREKAVVETDYIILGDGQFNLTVTTPKERDKAKAKKKQSANAKMRDVKEEEADKA